MSDDDTPPDPSDDLCRLRTHAEMLERRLQESELAAAARLLQAELKLEAVRAGMVDLDGLKMIDAATIAIGAQGEPLGLPDVMKVLKREKPWLFAAGTSSSAAAVPASAPARRKLATEMTMDEWRTARADLLRRR